ncbi:MAG: hypothetical protein A3J52_01685 [Omnitrophica bacterium RIFCSPHIGHO2_02_FULL_49_9]|nr:MAG: hypothetical protein A3J52_01685 [Omnitrophica bacterium RIFCSPHIGHO2_02_FULL_49_9]OGW88580.1 MAG: hypothetical protein A3A73_03965 [Omnitrophica bacterium RIFCSPLOWO2_01_FULL_50_24]
MSRTLKGLSLFLLMAFAAPLTGVANDVKGNNLQAGETYDLIIDAMPRSVNLIDTGSFANAAESVKDMDQLEAIVSFRVINVIQEPKPKRKALPSLDLSRAVNAIVAFKPKQIFKRDWMSGKEDLTERWFRIAVKDVYKAFGIVSWDEIEPVTFRIYLEQTGDKQGTYLMVKSEKLV